MESKGITLSWLFRTSVNSLCIGVMAALVVNFSYAPWSWNPIEDLLYVRTQGFLLPANHISSALAVAIPAFVFAMREPDKAYRWMFVIFSTASIHEYILDAMDVAVGFVSQDWLSYALTLRWFFWLAVFLVPGVILATKRQRGTMALIAAFCFVYITAWLLIAGYFQINTYTILGYAPGPAYYSFVPNFFEVSSWVIPASFWWFRR